MENSESIEQLKAEIERLKKINSALMKRVENRSSRQGEAFSLFEGKILLEKQVKERTRKIEEVSRALAEGKNRLSQLVKALPGAVLTIDSNCKVEAVEKVGVFPEGVDVRFLFDIFGQSFSTQVENAMRTAQTSRASVTFDFLYRHEDGKEYFYYCGLSHLKGSFFLLYLQENTENYLQKKMIHNQEIQLAQASKLSALGEMAGGVAHEINTPLGAILLSAGQIERCVKNGNDQKILEFSQIISNTVDRISKIIKSLRQISRDSGGEEFSVCLASDLVDDSTFLCNEKFKSNGVSLEVVGEKDLLVTAKQVQISQVLLNLLNNSFYVAKQTDRGWIKLFYGRVGELVRFRVVDCGNGIPLEVQEKLFDPFFTTKDIGEGTGLGMSVSRKIITDHDSTLNYELTEAGNTSFYFDLKLSAS